MHGCRRFALPAGLALLALAAGCQTSPRGTASDGGPSRSFGLNYVPRQSEPPIEPSDDVATRGGTPIDDDLDAGDKSAAKTSGSLTRMFSGRDKEPAQRKALPVSASSAHSDDDGDLEP
ncbi:MAG TPA: hypothetical protein VKU82_06135 [Planctomycetaceae bacterium]|nr:hypothetical protein [Planctomycetaceae bacterium]